MPDPQGTPSFDEWLQSGIASGRYGRTKGNTVYDAKVATLVPGANQMTTKELIARYQQEIGEGQAMGRYKPPVDPMDAEIEAFYKRMMDLRPDDPEVQQAMQFAGSQASNEAKLRGIDGSIAVSEVARQGGQALNGLRQFRQGLGMQALGLRSNRDLGLKQLGEQARQFDYSAGQSAYGNRVGLGQTIGSVGGGLIGAYFGQPMLGSQLGGAAGGAIAGAGGGGYPQPASYGSYGNAGGGGPSYGRGY